jgi:RNase P subunit RPR2
MGKQSLPRKWRCIIWREWRNCQDQEYAEHLFDLVADEPAGSGSAIAMALLGAFYGILGGLLVGLIAANWDVWNRPIMWRLLSPALPSFVWRGGAIGSAGGLVAGVIGGRRLSWRSWLSWLDPKDPAIHNSENGLEWLLEWLFDISFISARWFGLCFGLASELIFGLAGESAGQLARGLAFSLTFGVASGPALGFALGILLGLYGGLSIGILALGLSGIVGSGFDLNVGLIIGLFIGRLGSALGLCLGIFTASLVGMSWGVVLGEDGWTSFDGRVDRVCRYRSWCFWLRKRPYTTELERALYYVERPRELLRRLETVQGELDPPGALVAALREGRWTDRFTARHALVAWGGEAVEPLMAMTQDNHQRRTATWLLRSIARETTARLKRKASRLLCPRCLVRCARHRERIPWRRPFTYYGCRACGQSRKFLDWPGEVVAVLDTGMTEGQVQRDNQLRVNWLQRQSLFDFDQVEILQATDKEVQTFAVQVANDTDTFRQRRYRKMRCTVAEGCQLSKNTLRALKGRFPPLEQRGSDG